MKLKTILINLDRNPERLKFMSKQLKEQGIEFERLQAIDGRSYVFSKVYDESLCIKKNGHPMTNGEKGCALSHINAYEEFLNSNSDYLLVLEDDIELPLDFFRVLDEVISNRDSGKESWEYLTFNYPAVGTIRLKLWMFSIYRIFVNGNKLMFFLNVPIFLIKFFILSIFSFFEKIRERIYVRIFRFGKPALFFRPLYLAGAYLVTRNGAKKLLNASQRSIIYPADRLPNIARVRNGLKFYAFVPLLVRQRRDLFESTLAQTNDFLAFKKAFGKSINDV